MKLSHRDLLWLVLLLAASGCGSDNNVRLVNDLKGVGVAYHNYHDTFSKGPANWEELAKTSIDAQQIQRVRDAGYQVKWGVKFSEVTEGTSNTVLAEKPGGGGPKLMMDGSVQQ
jgi:hypothetical protein